MNGEDPEIVRLNVARYRALLRRNLDGDQRKRVADLLLECEAQLLATEGRGEPPGRATNLDF